MTAIPTKSLVRFLARQDGVSAVEFSLTMPAVFAMVGILLFGGFGFEISRKVTLAATTLTNLAAQQTNIGTSSGGYTYTQILTAAGLVIAPYDSTQLSMTLSEVQTNGTANGTVVWSKATGGAVALSAGASYAVPANLSASSYVLVGSVSYVFNPLNLLGQLTPITLSDTIYMAPRAASSVSCCS